MHLVVGDTLNTIGSFENLKKKSKKFFKKFSKNIFSKISNFYLLVDYDQEYSMDPSSVVIVDVVAVVFLVCPSSLNSFDSSDY